MKKIKKVLLGISYVLMATVDLIFNSNFSNSLFDKIQKNSFRTSLENVSAEELSYKQQAEVLQQALIYACMDIAYSSDYVAKNIFKFYVDAAYLEAVVKPGLEETFKK